MMLKHLNNDVRQSDLKLYLNVSGLNIWIFGPAGESTACRVFILDMSDLVSIPGTLYGSNLTEVIPECRAGSKP